MRSVRHGELDIVVTATRRVTGVTVVVTDVHGGPHRLKRQFYTLSPLADAAEAAAAAIDSIGRMLDAAGVPTTTATVTPRHPHRRPVPSRPRSKA